MEIGNRRLDRRRIRHLDHLPVRVRETDAHQPVLELRGCPTPGHAPAVVKVVEGEGALYQDLRMRLFNDPADLRARYAASPEWLQRLMIAWADAEVASPPR